MTRRSEASLTVIETLGIDDFTLTYSSEHKIGCTGSPVQTWEVGMHLSKDASGVRIGHIRLLLVDHYACDNAAVMLSELSRDLSTIGQALYDPVTGDFRDDLWESLFVAGKAWIIDRAEIDHRLRGHGLGTLLAGIALEYLCRESGVIALLPNALQLEDFEDSDGMPHETRCPGLSQAWARLGFALYRDGVWVLDPALAVLRTSVQTESERLRHLRWQVTFRPNGTGRNVGIADIQALISEHGFDQEG
ncbi:hypothetical protein ABZ848_35725 [Streptomyces sp. NPDC047081]|uniref:hypothetical protein n=1 Tax=Streptomyces sp. NPDC047081 TaxID=3154706 RepID=UPI0033DB279C